MRILLFQLSEQECKIKTDSFARAHSLSHTYTNCMHNVHLKKILFNNFCLQGTTSCVYRFSNRLCPSWILTLLQIAMSEIPRFNLLYLADLFSDTNGFRVFEGWIWLDTFHFHIYFLILLFHCCVLHINV